MRKLITTLVIVLSLLNPAPAFARPIDEAPIGSKKVVQTQDRVPSSSSMSVAKAVKPAVRKTEEKAHQRKASGKKQHASYSESTRPFHFEGRLESRS